MAVVRIDFSEAVLGGACEVKGVGASEECCRGSLVENVLQPELNEFGQRDPFEKALFSVADKLLHRSMEI